MSIEDLEFSNLGRSGKPWLGFYVAVVLLATAAGLAWGAWLYFHETSAPPKPQCELRGVNTRAGIAIYECPGGAALIAPLPAPDRLVPLPTR